MIYIVFDTNIWVYLANGYDSEKGNYFSGMFSEHHFELLKKIKEKTSTGKYRILINDIIIKEWQRNQQNTEELINCLSKRKTEIDNSLKLIKAFLSESDYETQKELIRKSKLEIENKIVQNKTHINEVEKFLLMNCIHIPISENVLKKVSELAMEKSSAPFLSDKNNFPDAVILYSSVEYLEDKLKIDESRGIFISNNFKDFTDSSNIDEFHSDIKKSIGSLDLTYVRHLTKLIDFGESLEEDINYFLELKREAIEESHFQCQNIFCEFDENYFGSGYFNNTIRVANSIEEFEDPNQLKIFPIQKLSEVPTDNIKTVDIGKCDICGTIHIACPNCKSLMINEDTSNGYYCNECEEFYEIKYSQRNHDKIIIKKTYSAEIFDSF